MLAWFRAHHRDLPWRRSRDPYRIWVAEVMLQQTRIAAVMPYYQRFLARFPTVAITRARTRTGSPETLVRPRLLQPRPQSASRRKNYRHAAQRTIPARTRRRARAPRHRHLHRRRRPEHRLRCSASRTRWQRRASLGAHKSDSRRSARSEKLARSHRSRAKFPRTAKLPAIGINR